MAVEQENVGPLTAMLAGTAAQYGGQGGAGSNAQDILGSLGVGSELQAILAAEAAGAASPLAAAAATTTGMQSLLPPWARDLQILGLGKEEAPPELFVFMRDIKVPGVENPTQFDTPQGLREGNDAVPTDTSRAQTVTRAMNQPYLWEEDELKEAMKRMQAAGLDVQSFDDVNDVWQGLVERAAITFSASEGEKKVTPWDVLDMVQRETAGSVDEDGNRTTTATHHSIDQISEGEAWSTLQSNLSQMLGRDPSDQEVRDFTYRMNQLAARNPSISKTISKYKDGELVDSTTRETSAGFTASDVVMKAYDKAQADPEYAEFQASTTYFDAAVSALGAIGGA